MHFTGSKHSLAFSTTEGLRVSQHIIYDRAVENQGSERGVAKQTRIRHLLPTSALLTMLFTCP